MAAGERAWMGTIGVTGRVVHARTRRQATGALLDAFNIDAVARGLAPFDECEIVVRPLDEDEPMGRVPQ